MRENTCVCCGREIPEGLQVCKFCETNASKTTEVKDHTKLLRAVRLVLCLSVIITAVFVVIFNK